jgi:hypothetical protein
MIVRTALPRRLRVYATVIRAVKMGGGLNKQSGRVEIAKLLQRNRAIVGDLIQAAGQIRQVSGFAGRSFARQQARADHQRGEDLP